ncbi:hypothetical protein A0J61_10522 [Choanephora cucurbitarum]|uniref:Uncharacterized protein n=1 Tax=Choanephora cucurbitarum TaxID=101091 RepID=A0A1C7MX93_9FUNG|nr:hypothetical protein A0J61_10522 [Choanephora cucurbitarum]
MNEALLKYKLAINNAKKRSLKDDSSDRIGSVPSRDFIRHNRVDFDRRLNEDYFNTPCRYTTEVFLRHFRMSKDLFLRIETGMLDANP